MTRKNVQWTGQQLRAIKARSSDIYVTASAGTGKTSVLSGRFVDMLRDKNLRPDVQNILVLTFTDAAAEQMRSRIARQLRDSLSQQDEPYLRRQLILLQAADVSTIHSFCKKLITEYFYKLSLDPAFRVIDQDEQWLLKTEVLEKTVDWAWKQDHLKDVLGELLYRRDLRTVEGFAGNIIRISDFLDGLISPQNWFDKAVKISEIVEPASSELGEKQKEIIKEKIATVMHQLEHCRKIYSNQRTGGDWDRMCEKRYIEPAGKYRELLESGRWDEFVECIRDYKKPTVYKPKDVPDMISGLIHKKVANALESLDNLKELAVINPEYLQKVHGTANRQIKTLVELVKKFDRMYTQAKQEINCLDFADLEHYALRLLTDDLSAEKELQPSQTALQLRKRYRFLFVDEYQDINSVQEAILKLLASRDNIFVVGDVKQSIYSWRGAEPEIFLNHLESASLEQTRAENGFRVDLNANFRSADGILNFVNSIFERIMTSSFGSFDYDDSARLRPGMKESPQKSSEQPKPEVEMHIIDSRNTNATQFNDSDNGTGRFYTGRQYEAAMIARRIRKMVGADTGKAEFQIFDKDQNRMRDVQYRDIVVLMRSVAKKKDFPEILRSAGVPVSCPGIEGYFEATEIRDVLALLKVLDNPLRDIELAAVMRSPVFKINDSELAKIKIFSGNSPRKMNFYAAVRNYMQNGPDAELAGKLQKTLYTLDKWRGLARKGNLADLIWQIYRETGLISFVRALDNGRARKANLLNLHDRAIQFEAFASTAAIPSLTRFVQFIEKLQETGRQWSRGEAENAPQNSVRVLSIHKSKGLEFPVVFLADLDSRFNIKDYTDDCLTDAEDTLGLQVVKTQTNSKLPSLAHQVITERRRKKSLSEEMRILYVATTRAREKLVLTASKDYERCRRIITDGLLTAGEKISHSQLDSCRSPLEWVLYALSDRENLHRSFQTGLDEGCLRTSAQSSGAPAFPRFHDDDGLFNLKVYGSQDIKDLSSYINALKNEYWREHRGKNKRNKTHTDNKLLKDIKKSINWNYPFSEACELPAKRSVTQLTHHTDEFIRMDYSGALQRRPRAVNNREQEQFSVQGSTIGSATHLLISKLELTSAVTPEKIEQTREKLLRTGAITGAAAEAIDTGSILGFFRSGQAKRLLSQALYFRRDWSFTFALPIADWRKIEGGSDDKVEEEYIITQGIIDLLVKTPEGLVVVDFKTDDISEQEISERAQAYRVQLELYGLASGAILDEKTVSKWLYFLKPARWFQIK